MGRAGGGGELLWNLHGAGIFFKNFLINLCKDSETSNIKLKVRVYTGTVPSLTVTATKFSQFSEVEFVSFRTDNIILSQDLHMLSRMNKIKSKRTSF